jgi:hypothetical protein
MALRYQTGEEIHRGDRVTYGDNPGVIELVVEALTGEPEEDWLFETNGAGIMVAERKVFGRVFSTILMRMRIFVSLAAQNDVCRTTADRRG